MKRSKALIKTQRKSLDEKLVAFSNVKAIANPKAGWVRAIREALGMTTSQLAQRMKIQQSGVTLLEQREAEGKVTLETLNRAARAMNCELVYALVPTESLEKIVDEQSIKAAQQLLRRAMHTMALELQQVGNPETEMHEKDLAAEIKTKLDRRLWDKK